MKKLTLIIIILLASLTIGCKSKTKMISDVDEFEALFTGSIKYDIRNNQECEIGHIPGFMCMGDLSIDELINNIDIVAKDKKQNIILIGNDEVVRLVYKSLSKKGYKNLYYFENGYNGYLEKKGLDFKPETGCGC